MVSRCPANTCLRRVIAHIPLESRQPTTMSRREVQRSVMASEFYWHGSTLGAPKVYEPTTNFNAPPTLRGGESSSNKTAEAENSGRSVSYRSTEDGWEVVFDAS